MNKKPFHEIVAQKLIAQLKQGTAPWQIPWRLGSPNAWIPMNPITGKRYKGINAIQLMAEERNDNRWLTYKQAISLDAEVRKGEKGKAIQYWKFTDVRTKTDENGKPILDAEGVPIKVAVKLERPQVFFATVFNAEQLDGLSPLGQKEPVWNAIERAEQILTGSCAIIRHGENNKAFYQVATDTIHLPGKDRFLHAASYYATALHELAHWTGHSSRLDRDSMHPFGSIGYAKEELRAEITSMILGDELGIGHDSGQHAAYVASWIKLLQDDPLELFRAAAEAEKIQTYVLSLEQQQVQQRKQENTVNDSQILSGEKVWLSIPFQQKDVAKQVAGTLPNGQKAIGWDKAASRWFAHPGADLDKLTLWLTNDAIEKTPNPPAIQENSTTEKIRLVVPYTQREVVKQLAGKLPDGSKAVE